MDINEKLQGQISDQDDSSENADMVASLGKASAGAPNKDVEMISAQSSRRGRPKIPI